MSVLSRTVTILALLGAAGLACHQPAPAPAPSPAPRTAPAPPAAPAKAKTLKLEDTPKRLAEDAGEASRKAGAGYQQAAQNALQDVHFALDNAVILEADKPVLRTIATFMKQYPKANVFIDGNCDERGTVEYNLALGERRAHAALAYLVNLGVPAGRLSMTTYGKEKPLCTASQESCWARNRRAHFTLLK